MLNQTLMRYLQGLNWTLLVLGATLFVNLAVVCLLYFLHLDQAPRYRAEFDSVVLSTLLFFGVALAAATAIWGQRRQFSWRWLAEGVLALTVFGSVWHFLPK